MSDESPEQPPPDQTQGHVPPTPGGLLTVCGVVGLVGGWLVRPLSQRFADTSPLVTWLQVSAFWFVALLLFFIAWVTHRTITHRHYLAPQRAVNRLVLAKACALVAALAAGGYAGYALAWVGMAAELADERVVRSGVAAGGALLMCVAALVLERACRVRQDDDAA